MALILVALACHGEETAQTDTAEALSVSGNNPAASLDPSGTPVADIGARATDTAPIGPAKARSGSTGAPSRSLAAVILKRAEAPREAPVDEAGSEPLLTQGAGENEEGGIPGAVVSLIFGLFGLLVIARRNLR